MCCIVIIYFVCVFVFCCVEMCSNWGDCVDVWAPGVDIYSAVADSDSSYDSYQGTSMLSY